jgi:hypothetical protein
MATKLNPKQLLFCKLYASDIEFFGNGTQSYIHAYKPKQVGNWYKTVMSCASALLRNPKVCEEINRLLELDTLNNVSVDKQLAFIITQYSDLQAKMAAIREYNKLKQRIVERTDITSDNKPLVFDNAFAPKTKTNSEQSS